MRADNVCQDFLVAPWQRTQANAGGVGLIPGLGRSPGKGNGNPFQYSCLKNPWTEEPGGLQSMGSQRIRYNQACTHTHTHTQNVC